MIVTVWHATNPRQYYRTYRGVARVSRGEYGDITLYTHERSEADLGQTMATFGPGDCWAIETEEVTP